MEIFYEKNKNFNINQLVSFFQNMGLARSTSYRKVKRLRGGNLKRKLGSGRKAIIATAANIQIIAQKFNNKDGSSQKKSC